jgi:hypothetical protein
MDPDNRDFLKLLKDAEAAINALLTALAAQLIRIVTDRTRRGRVPSQFLIDQAIQQYVDGYRAVVTDAVANAAGLQADRNAARLLPRLEEAGASAERHFMDERFTGYREVIRRRFPTQRHPEDQRTFEQRVTTVRRGFERLVYQTVQTGVDEGIDPRKLAFAIRDAVVMTPPRTRTEAYREAARLRNQASTYVYRGAPSGSIQYNSMRIVRTEMAGVYRRSVTDFYEDRPYTEGFDWVLSTRHERTDKCNSNASGSPYKARADLPSTHPNCLCRVFARIMSQAQLKRLIASGALD